MDIRSLLHPEDAGQEQTKRSTFSISSMLIKPEEENEPYFKLSNGPKTESLNTSTAANGLPLPLQRSLSEDTTQRGNRPSVGGHLLRSRLSPQRNLVEPESDSNVSVSSTGSLKRRRRQLPKAKLASAKPPPLPPQLSHDMNSSDGGTSPDSGNYYGESESNDGEYEDDGSIGDTARELKSLHLRKAGRFRKSQTHPSRSNHSKPTNLSATNTSSGYDRPYTFGDKIECIKSDEQGTWHVARIVDFETYPASPDSNIFVHYEGFPPEQDEWVPPHLIRCCGAHHPFLRHGPRGAEQDRSWRDFAAYHQTEEAEKLRTHTAIAYDKQMLLHACPCGCERTIHPERPDRLVSIMDGLYRNGLMRYFRRLQGREATVEELLSVHTETHVRNYCSTPSLTSEPDAMVTDNDTQGNSATSILSILNPEDNQVRTRHGSGPGAMLRGVGGDVVVQADADQIRRQHRRFSTAMPDKATKPSQADQETQDASLVPITPPTLVCKMTCGELGIAVDTTFHPLHSSKSARMAAGTLLNVVDQVVNGRIKNGFALIRPPGHHAEEDEAMGFCFFNNVGVAASLSLKLYRSLVQKVLIIDWDIHHGNGTQRIFYNNPNVLFISIHRWDSGKFYPFSGAPDECGDGPGLGFNVNIAFSELEKQKPMGDTEFIAAFYHLVLPISRQFNPDLIFVSAGFDAAEGHPENLGGYCVTPRGYGIMTSLVRELADEVSNGRLVLSLEGGYALQPLANSAVATMVQLLPQGTVPADMQYDHTLQSIKPNAAAVASLRRVSAIQSQHWKLDPALLDEDYRFHLPTEWKAQNSISTRPRRDKRQRIAPKGIEGY
ncbi:hypothetical protein K450DRAFT_249410 [Umbelopsis ramanniana AG]|uniref:histone deacetylase n=1 Tax=Umbelopsis ramanniana AG TaxID=1314678 RepID=A0AAD5E5T4_UMBRA|nr:uncharacterized protein K450DRAFT_249410 [Umbelopsis ramanniana AG]KAI8577993.1 hypothetical protein K450DRAFT_249410 [Umbelopsis ramanniana AG]